MLRYTAFFVTHAPPPPEDDLDFAKWAHLESCLIHTRNLWDFMTDKGRKPDDVLARFYNDDAAWRPSGGTPQDVELINKYVAHITSQRITERAWNAAGFEAVTLDAFAEFVQSVTPGRRAWFAWFLR